MTLRVVVVAAGSHIFQAAHIPALVAIGAEVVGIIDADAQRAQAVAVAHGWRAASDLDELLALDSDAVVVCTPHPMHAELVIRSLGAGRAVLVEKPVAPRLSEIDAIVSAADAADRPVGVVHQHRLRDEVVVARRLIGEGRLGRIHRAVVVASYPKRSVYYTDTPWRGTWRGEGGGVLLNQGLHDVDLLVHLLGRPARVAASLRTLVHPIEAEDTADLLLEWDEGATAVVHITSAAALDGNRIEVHGSAGALRLTSGGLDVREADEDFDHFADEPGGHFDAFPMSGWRPAVRAGGGAHADVYADFAAAVAKGTSPLVTPASARCAVEVIAAAALASERRQAVDLPVDAETADELLDARIAVAATGSRL